MEILATIPVYSYPWFYNLAFSVALMMMLVGLGTGLFLAIEKQSWGAFIVGVALIVTGGLGGIHSSEAMDRTSYLDYTKYKVTINETITAQELLDQYEILSREGEIFTIREIEVDK